MQYVVADVIVNKTTEELDKPFSYLVPEKLKDKLSVGSRVLVPFGKGNHNIEGYVINIREYIPDLKLKEVLELIDTTPVFDNNMLKLAEWMKNEYMCTLLDCIKCIVPTGISIKTFKTFLLNQDADISKVRGSTQRQIINIIKNNGCEITSDELSRIIGNKNYFNSIQQLIDNKIIKVEYKFTHGVTSRSIRVALLNISNEEAKFLQETLPERCSAQKRILDILIDNEFVAVSDLVKFANTTHSVINNLYKKGIIKFDELEINRDPYVNTEYNMSKPLPLTNEQQAALNQILESLKSNRNDKFLIHGVTGSGKTEVYLQAIEYVINNKGHAIVLVPEISLTPQMVRIFKSRFGEKVAVIHSRLTLGERYDQWKKIKNGEVSIVVGARSAIFAPFSNLKLIIIDEEHETSYKSENKPKYHVKDIAEVRSKIENCVVVLGSATPSVDTYYEAQSGKYKLIEIKKRVNECILPRVEIIDMRKELEEGNRSIFSRALFEEIGINIKNKEQTILFLNRRGYSTFVSCRKCGFVLKCPNCNITLTYHKYNDTVICHYCGFERRNPTKCPACSSKYIKYFGIGTQKVEDEVKKLYPEASVIRMDFDTTGSKFSHEKLLDKFKNENIDILIGTQMIAKGLDFPNVTLVGVVSADTSLNIEDFRSSERTFQLLTQVSGRAGRDKKPGRVIIQTYQPDNFSILTAQSHDYKAFYENEILNRKNLVYPPFVNLISIIISHSDNKTAKKFALECALKIKTEFNNNGFRFLVLRPTPAPLSKIKNMYRWRILIKVDKNNYVQDVLKAIQKQFYNKVNISIDINSNNML